MRTRSIVASVVLLAGLVLFRPGPAFACSPPFEPPTIAALGPAQVVVVGTTGERVSGGRLFHVARWFNGQGAATPILIDFKEGPAVGDCSYPVGVGVPLIIAPDMSQGKLSANLATLQADPASELGRTYVTEATSLFGPGVIPPAAPGVLSPEPVPGIAAASPDITVVAAFIVFGVAAVFVGVVLLARRTRSRA